MFLHKSMESPAGGWKMGNGWSWGGGGRGGSGVWKWGVTVGGRNGGVGGKVLV